jgi:phenylacetate-CoA ligase
MLRQSDPKDAKTMGRMLHASGLRQRLKIDGLQEPALIVEQLRCYRPDVITGVPGILCQVADYLLKHGCKGLAPRVLIVGGEVLTPVMRRNLQQGFGAPLHETYASHEFPLLGWECAGNGQFHTCDDGVILEVLHEGRPAALGERGEVVVTNLHAYSMPFIRYRLGDIAIRGDQSCSCGQPFSTIRSIQGRMIDYFKLSNGRMVHPYCMLQSIMPGTETWIRQYQFVQDRPDRIVMRVVSKELPPAEATNRITRAVTPLLGPGIEFELLIVDDIPLDPSGKFRHARSLVQSPYDGLTTSLAHA